MISERPGYAALASVLETFHEKEADARVDMAGTPLHEYLIEGYEYNYIREFLECFETDKNGVFDSIVNLGNEAGNHNQLLYFCTHIMPYLIKDAPDHLHSYLVALADACETSYDQTEMWNEWDDEDEITKDMEEIVMYAEEIQGYKDACDEALWEDVETTVVQILAKYLLA